MPATLNGVKGRPIQIRLDADGREANKQRAVAANVKPQDGREAVVSIPDVSIPDRTSRTDAGKRTVPAASNRSAAHSAARHIVADRNAAVLRARPHAASSSPPSAQLPVRAQLPAPPRCCFQSREHVQAAPSVVMILGASANAAALGGLCVVDGAPGSLAA